MFYFRMLGIGYRLSDSPKKCPTFSGTKLLLFFEIAKFLAKIPDFCTLDFAKNRKTCCKTYFYGRKFGRYAKKQYLCTVFFMVLDLRLSKDWVVGMTILLFFMYIHAFNL